jgi:hypothetical protein
MFTARVLAGIGLLAASLLLIDLAAGDNYQIRGSGPGPIANKKGEFAWKLEFDALNTRACWIQATYPGCASTRQGISAISATSLHPTCWRRLNKS